MKYHLAAATILANLLDNSIPFFGYRFGLSALFDLIPGIGDIIDALLSFYLVWIALELQVPTKAIAQMIGNIAINFFVGLIPVIGDAVYFVRKANMKNLRIIKTYAPTIVEGEIVNKPFSVVSRR